MRIPKLLLTVCAMTVCAGFISIRAADTPAQAAARSALEQKMNELDGQSSQANAAPAAPPAQPAPSAAAIETPPPAATVDSTSSAETNTEAQATAEAALQQKMNELGIKAEQPKQGGAVLVNSSGAVVVAPAAVTQTAPAATPTPTSGSGFFEPAEPTPANTEAQAAAQAALQQRMAELNQGQTTAQPAATQTQSSLFSSTPATSSSSYAGGGQGFQPIVAPPLPISASKQSQLQALTARYKANQISPEDYFKQREAVLAQP